MSLCTDFYNRTDIGGKYTTSGLAKDLINNVPSYANRDYPSLRNDISDKLRRLEKWGYFKRDGKRHIPRGSFEYVWVRVK